MLTPEEIKDSNQKKFQERYTLDDISINKSSDPKDYFSKLVDVRLGYIKKHCSQKKVLDIGCGRGDYLFELRDMIAGAYGIDYTDKAIEAANSKKESFPGVNIQFIKADAKRMPFDDAVFDLVFSFSTLSSVPHLEEVVLEIGRVLKPNAVAILEIGNVMSLNTIVCEAHPELAKQCHIKISDIRRIISDARMTLTDWRAFGILPFWGKKPGWLRPLLHERWKKFFQKEINGKMLDEWVSNSFLLKPFAYRHFIFIRNHL